MPDVRRKEICEDLVTFTNSINTDVSIESCRRQEKT